MSGQVHFYPDAAYSLVFCPMFTSTDLVPTSRACKQLLDSNFLKRLLFASEVAQVVSQSFCESFGHEWAAGISVHKSGTTNRTHDTGRCIDCRFVEERCFRQRFSLCDWKGSPDPGEFPPKVDSCDMVCCQRDCQSFIVHVVETFQYPYFLREVVRMRYSGKVALHPWRQTPGVVSMVVKKLCHGIRWQSGHVQDGKP